MIFRITLQLSFLNNLKKQRLIIYDLSNEIPNFLTIHLCFSLFFSVLPFHFYLPDIHHRTLLAPGAVQCYFVNVRTACIPLHIHLLGMHSRLHSAQFSAQHLSPGHIIDRELNFCLLLQFKCDMCGRIEGVGIVGMQLKWAKYGNLRW